MCDTVVVVGDGAVLFAKNSDRDANEAQVLDWQPRRRHPPGSKLRATWIEIPQAEETWAVVLSRPFWMWGAEMGANEHGVVIGNEAVFTRRPKLPTGLTGMDLLRLALERARTADEAVRVIAALIAEHGQGGGCGHEDRSFTYHSSFLVADPRGAVVLETAGGLWAAEGVGAGARSISNVLTIPGFAREHGDFLFTRVAAGDRRRSRTEQLAREARGPIDMMGLLRDHGEGRDTPRYRWVNGSLGAPCMHGGGALANAVTTASWVSELRTDGVRHWATATPAPCTGLFKPVRLGEPVDLGSPADRADGSLWWRHERLHRRVAADPARLGALFTGERDEVEARWLESPPSSREAFAEGDRLLDKWTRQVAGTAGRDVRPFWTRRYWKIRDRRAGLEDETVPQ